MRGKWAGRAGLVALPLPFIAVLVGARWAVPKLGDAIARDAWEIASMVPSAEPAASSVAPALPADDAGVGATDAPLDAGGAGSASASGDGAGEGTAAHGARGASATSAGKKRMAIRVPVAAVERALNDGGETLHARTTRGPDGKPAGVKLTGVPKSLGFQDGDIIVAVDGKPTMDDDTATALALAVIGRGDSVLRALVMRGDQPIDVTLALPSASTDAGKTR